MIRRQFYSFVLAASIVPMFQSCAGSSLSPAGNSSAASHSDPAVASRGGQESRAEPQTEADNRDGQRTQGDSPSTSVAAATIAPDANRESPAAPATAATRPDIYNTSADAAADVAAAIARAKKDNKRVLVMFGGNWCHWCYQLHDVFQKDREVATTLRNDYERVMVDVGHFDKNIEIATSYGADLKAHGVPFLTVLDSNGQVLTNQDTGELEKGPVHDTQKVRDFLQRWAAEQVDAEQVLADALTRAQSEEKRVFVHLGAPWCGWCNRLDQFLDEHGALLEGDYVLVKIDIDRMTQGKLVAGRLRGTEPGGIPWIAILDATGEKLVTSDGPAGNIGYPAEPQEIEYFIKMLNGTAKVMSTEQISQVEALLTEAAKHLTH